MSKLVQSLMGQVVVVEKVYERVDLEPVRNGYVLSTKKGWGIVSVTPRPGWVVGERWLQSGTVYSSGYDDSSYWTRGDISYHCFLVAYWPTTKPVRVPLDGFKPANGVAPYRTPGCPYTEGWRKEMCKEMSNWPRNDKGQWVKKERKKP